MMQLHLMREAQQIINQHIDECPLAPFLYTLIGREAIDDATQNGSCVVSFEAFVEENRSYPERFGDRIRVDADSIGAAMKFLQKNNFIQIARIPDDPQCGTWEVTVLSFPSWSDEIESEPPPPWAPEGGFWASIGSTHVLMESIDGEDDNTNRADNSDDGQA